MRKRYIIVLPSHDMTKQDLIDELENELLETVDKINSLYNSKLAQIDYINGIKNNTIIPTQQ